MSRLKASFRGESYVIDEFFKSLMFQTIMDASKLNRNERAVLLVVFRKTLHYDKRMDTLGIHWLSKAARIGEHTTRTAIKGLIEKKFLKKEISQGGQSSSKRRFNSFGISDGLLEIVFRQWIKLKEESGYV